MQSGQSYELNYKVSPQRECEVNLINGRGGSKPRFGAVKFINEAKDSN